MKGSGMLAKKMICLVALVALSPQAFANYFCTGTVSLVAIYPVVGTVVVSSAGLNYVYLCQTSATYNGIAPEQCKAILSMLLTARATGQRVTWAFQDSLSCTNHPSDQALTGWYYGPQVHD